MKNIINKISQAVQVVLLAPIKLPGKALNILKYVAVGLGVIESVLGKGDQESGIGKQESDNGKQESDNGKQEEEIRDRKHGEEGKVIIGYIDDYEQAEGDIAERKEVSDEATE